MCCSPAFECLVGRRLAVGRDGVGLAASREVLRVEGRAALVADHGHLPLR